MSGLCRVVYARGRAQVPRGGPRDQITGATVGIIREAALWRLCRSRHKRHTFAVHRLTEWYRQGADVQRLLHHLSVYLGHAYLAAAQVYLTMTPELLHEAGTRFERYSLGEDGHA
jgi:site-specific recombinase XerD